MSEPTAALERFIVKFEVVSPEKELLHRVLFFFVTFYIKALTNQAFLTIIKSTKPMSSVWEVYKL